MFDPEITFSLLTRIESKQIRNDDNCSILIHRRVNVKFIFLSNTLYFLLHILVDDNSIWNYFWYCISRTQCIPRGCVTWFCIWPWIENELILNICVYISKLCNNLKIYSRSLFFLCSLQITYIQITYNNYALAQPIVRQIIIIVSIQ